MHALETLAVGPAPQHHTMPLSVVMLSISTFFINCSSVIVFTCMPLVLKQCFGLATADAGAIEGVVEAFSLIIRAFSGMISDIGRKRKSFLMVGYGISLVSRFLAPLSPYVWMITLSRFMDKLGNGIQASPREAFIVDASPKSLVGKCFGLNKAFAMMGSSLGSVALWWGFHTWGSYWAENLMDILWVSAALMVVATLLLAWGTQEPFVSPALAAAKAKVKNYGQELYKLVADIPHFPRAYWFVLAMACLFKLGYFSGAYIMLFVQGKNFASFLGIPILHDIEIPALVMSVQNVSCALLTYPMGFFSDKFPRKSVVAFGFFAMLASLLCFGFGGARAEIVTLGIVLYGVQMSMQGALLAFLSDTMPASLRGTGFGIFYFLTGISVLVANVLIMRPLCKLYSPEVAFLVVCVPIALALVLLMMFGSLTEVTTKEGVS